MSFQLVPKSVSLNDLERRNGQWPLFMAALCNRAGHVYFHPVVSSFFCFSSPNLSGRRLDVDHTSTHGVALVYI